MWPDSVNLITIISRMGGGGDGGDHDCTFRCFWLAVLMLLWGGGGGVIHRHLELPDQV